MLRRRLPQLMMATVAVAIGVPPVSAGTPDGQSAPRSVPAMLDVVQDAGGYVIRARAAGPAEKPDRTTALLPLGASLKLDRALFDAPTPPAKEAVDASRR